MNNLTPASLATSAIPGSYPRATAAMVDGRDDHVDASESSLDGFFIRVVDWDHLGVAVNGGLGTLP